MMVFSGLASKSVMDFLIELQNQGGGEFSGLALKTDSYSLVIWASKSPRRFLGWASKLSRLQFVGCATKPTEGCDSEGYASRSSGLLRVEASQIRVSQSGIKTGRGVMTGGACGTITEVASKSS
jgi:hypothetical protein